MLNLFLEFRWTDALDIALVAALVYFAVVWIRRARAGMVAVGILILAIVYLAARALGLQLTAWIFQGFFAIFVVIVVVIFQEELRQLFERLAMFSLGRTDRRTDGDGTAEILVAAMADCARDRVGALVVLPGKQPIGRHVRGGISLQGRLSVPLLKSIFDPHSPGHDGAVVVEDGRLADFAVHLPLSDDFRQLAGVGTRHSAALGLAELTDALCVVVSEERGVISVARDRKLERLGSPRELSEALHRHLAGSESAPKGRRLLPHLLYENWLEKLVSIGFVLCLWYVFVPGSRPTQATFPVPVVLVNLPADLAVDEVAPSQVDVTFTAPARSFYLFDTARLRLRIDASLAAVGRRTFQVSEDSLTFPKEFSVDRINPSRIKLTVHKGAESSGTP